MFVAFTPTCLLVLLRSTVCSASDSGAGVLSGSVYGGYGATAQMENEGIAKYDEGHVGVGALALLRPWHTSQDTAGQSLGTFLLVGLGGEWRTTRSISNCSVVPCDFRTGFIPEAHMGTRLSVGYDFAGLGMRGGVLFMYSPEARIADTLLLPDFQFRFGAKSKGWFEVGFGAYDVSTTLRPGLYIGGALATAEHIQFSTHFGLHTPTGSFGHTVLYVAPRFDAGVDVEIAPNLRVGGGVALQTASLTLGVVELRSQVSLLF